MENVAVIINPGSGPVADSTESNAAENMKHFIVDCGFDDMRFVRVPDLDYGDGRFAFLLWRDTICHEIQMPGLPLSQVRYVQAEDQNIWHFPRLYVDGSSWVWCFAVLDKDSDWGLSEE